MASQARFLPFDQIVECNDGESAFDAARRSGLGIPTACSGKGTCGLCRVKVIAGEEFLPPMDTDEKKHLGNTYFITKLRLSCRLKIAPGGAVTLQIPDAKPAAAK